ncbi:unnamed protein product [Ilex paraguariensis]|uniref:Uncharacterized protein n=1 Tax=Ilex paraguariensis TaxID=185542 RepID=A0ABC8TP76_9AQUA
MTEVDATNSGRNVVSVEQGDSSHWKSMSEVDATNCGRNVVSTEHRAISSVSAVLALQNGGQTVQLDSSYQKNMAEVDATNNEKKFASAEQSDIADIPLEKRGPAEGSDREGEISREVLEILFGTDIENAAKILCVSRSTFKRKCRQHGIKRWPFPKRNRVTRSPSQLESIRGANKQTGESSRRDCLPCDKAPKQATTSIASTMPHASAKQNESSVTIKATYGDDIIKFQLSFSSGMVELEEIVAKRLNSKAGSFKIKYADEDDDSILVSCDEALQDCINSWRSSDRTTVKMLVLPIIN